MQKLIIAKEKRLIDANELLEVLELCEFDTECDRDTAYSQIKDAPTVDAVEVVRCKDCKWYQIRKWDDNKPQYDCRKTHALLNVKPNDFCSYGERREGE